MTALKLPCITQALKEFGDDVAIAFSGAEDVALIEYAHLTGRPFRVFRWFDITITPLHNSDPHVCLEMKPNHHFRPFLNSLLPAVWTQAA